MLELRGATCVRGTRALFKGLDLLVPAGRLLRVQGVNGAGKTSLLRLICGLLAPADGAVLWQGQNIAALREEFNRQMVFLGHAAALKDDLSAIENLLAACRLGGVPVSVAQARAALIEAGLRGRDHAPARILSQGRHVEFWLNGRKTIECERGSPEFRALVAVSKFHNIPGFGEWADGHILLQEHGSEVSFRNVKIRVLANR